jgi:hypothetical protein
MEEKHGTMFSNLLSVMLNGLSKVIMLSETHGWKNEWTNENGQ